MTNIDQFHEWVETQSPMALREYTCAQAAWIEQAKRIAELEEQLLGKSNKCNISARGNNAEIFTMAEFKKLYETLALRELEIVKLREALDKLARLGNEPKYGNSVGNVIAQEALSTTQPESVVKDSLTTQKPLSGMKILELADECKLDVIMSDAINFARAIEKAHGIGE